MIDLIQSIPDWQNKTAAEIVSELNAETVQYVDPQLYTWAGVALIAGPVGAEALRIALEQNGMGWAVHQLGGSGLQLSNDLVQQALLGFAQAGVPGCADLASTGKRLISKATQSGLPPVTEPDVSETLAALQLRDDKDALLADGAARWNAFADAVEAWDGNGEEPVL
jgi:hypothetical protein